MVTPRIRQPLGALLTLPKQQPRPLSAFEDFHESSYTPYSRPTSFTSSSEASSPRHTMTGRPPTLNEILLDTAPPPWSLSAFMAYLSQNHCMETLEFTLDSQRYATVYEQTLSEPNPSDDCKQRVCAWWEKLMQVYIIPCAPREVNIPAQVRDRLLRVPCGPDPPHPSELAEAGRIVYELMNDSVLVPFLQSVATPAADLHDFHLASPKASSDRTAASMGTDPETLTADSSGTSSSITEPMTPPTTPPTSEWTFTASHGGFHRAVAAHNKGWKKVGAALGFNRKSSSRRTTPTSSGPDSGESSYNSSGNSI